MTDVPQVENGLIHRMVALGHELADEVAQAMTGGTRSVAQIAVYYRSGSDIHRCQMPPTCTLLLPDIRTMLQLS